MKLLGLDHGKLFFLNVMNELFFSVFNDAFDHKKIIHVNDMDAKWEQLYEIDKWELMKLALVFTSYSKKDAKYRMGNKTVVFDVLGTRSHPYGISALYYILRRDPSMFYMNMYQIGMLFGGWKILIDLWECDIVRNAFKLEKCVLNRSRVVKFMCSLKGDLLCGPDIVKAFPIIRRLSKAKSLHRRARNIIGKYIRCMVCPKGEKYKYTRNKSYSIVRGMYKHKRVKYIKMDIMWMKTANRKELYEQLMNQEAFKVLRKNPVPMKSKFNRKTKNNG